MIFNCMAFYYYEEEKNEKSEWMNGVDMNSWMWWTCQFLFSSFHHLFHFMLVDVLNIKKLCLYQHYCRFDVIMQFTIYLIHKSQLKPNFKEEPLNESISLVDLSLGTVLVRHSMQNCDRTVYGRAFKNKTSKNKWIIMYVRTLNAPKKSRSTQNVNWED